MPPKERVIKITQAFKSEIVVPGKAPEVEIRVDLSEPMHPAEVNMIIAQGLSAMNQQFLREVIEAMNREKPPNVVESPK